MQLRHYLLPFALGVAVGVVVTRNWPRIREVTRPLLRGAVRGGSGLLEKGREAYHEQSEKFSDLIAEIREEEEAKAKGAPPAASTPPKGPAPA
jgi:hypothetical protein